MTESSIQADTGLCLVMDYDYALCRVVALGTTFGLQQRDLGILRARARP